MVYGVLCTGVLGGVGVVTIILSLHAGVEVTGVGSGA